MFNGVVVRTLCAVIAGVLLAGIAGAAAAQDKAKPRFRFVYISLFDDPKEHYIPLYGRTWVGLGFSDVSAEDARVKACESHVASREQLVAACRASPQQSLGPGADCGVVTRAHDEVVASCTAPQNGRACPESSFFAVARTDVERQTLPAAAGMSCGQKTLAAAQRAAIAACEKAGARKKVAGRCKLEISG